MGDTPESARVRHKMAMDAVGFTAQVLTPQAETLPASLAARLAASAHGWGAVIDGVLNIRTVTHTRNHAALNAIAIRGYTILGHCADPDCDCYVRFLAGRHPDDRIVPVTVRVVHEPGP